MIISAVISVPVKLISEGYPRTKGVADFRRMYAHHKIIGIICVLRTVMESYLVFLPFGFCALI